MCHTFSTSVPEIQKPTSACVYPRVTQLCQKAEEKTWGAHTAPGSCTEHLCYVMVLHASSQNIHTNARLVFGHYGGYHSPPCVFFNAPNQLPNHNIHRDINLNLLCLRIMCSRKSSRILDIFHTGDSSETTFLIFKSLPFLTFLILVGEVGRIFFLLSVSSASFS